MNLRIFLSQKGHRLLLNATLFFLAATLHAQPSYIYEGRNWDPNRIICNVWNGVLIEGEGQDMTMAVARTDGQYIYAGGGNSTFDILYTFRDNQLYEGESRMLSDVVCTISGSHIYRGDSQFALDMAYSYRDGYIFEGDGISLNDVVFTTDPPMSIKEVVLVLVAFDLL